MNHGKNAAMLNTPRFRTDLSLRIGVPRDENVKSRCRLEAHDANLTRRLVVVQLPHPGHREGAGMVPVPTVALGEIGEMDHGSETTRSSANTRMLCGAL